MKTKRPPTRPNPSAKALAKQGARASLAELHPSYGFRVDFTTEAALNLALLAPELLAACRETEKLLEKGFVCAEAADLDKLGVLIDEVLDKVRKLEGS